MADEQIHLDDYGDGSEWESSRPKFFAVFLLIIIAAMGAYLAFRWYEARPAQNSIETSAGQPR